MIVIGVDAHKRTHTAYGNLDKAQPNLLDPQADGHYLMARTFNACGDLDPFLAALG